MANLIDETHITSIQFVLSVYSSKQCMYVFCSILNSKVDLTKYIESAGGCSEANAVLRLAAVLSDVRLCSFAEFQTSHSLDKLQFTGWTGADFAFTFIPGHFDFWSSSYVTPETHCIPSCHFHRFQGLHKVWLLCSKEEETKSIINSLTYLFKKKKTIQSMVMMSLRI